VQSPQLSLCRGFFLCQIDDFVADRAAHLPHAAPAMVGAIERLSAVAPCGSREKGRLGIGGAVVGRPRCRRVGARVAARVTSDHNPTEFVRLTNEIFQEFVANFFPSQRVLHAPGRIYGPVDLLAV
jgi:hypothetical protein